MPAYSLLLPALCAVLPATVLAQQQRSKIEVSLLPAEVQLRVTGPQQVFLAAVLVSLDDQLAFPPFGPPLLSESVLLGAGIGVRGAGYELRIPEGNFPAGIPIYAQGVTFDGALLQSTKLDDFVLDGSAPAAGR